MLSTNHVLAHIHMMRPMLSSKSTSPLQGQVVALNGGCVRAGNDNETIKAL